MSLPTPHYELARVTDDGRCEEIEIHPLSEPPLAARLNRRGFFQAGLSAAAVLATLSGACARVSSEVASAVESASKPEEEPVLSDASCDDGLAHDVPVAALAVSPDGTALASAGRNGDVKLWTLPVGSLTAVLPDGYHEGRTLAFAADVSDRRTLLALRRKSLQRWQIAEGEASPLAAQAAAGAESFLALSPDGGAVAVLTPEIEVRSLSGGEPRRVPDLRRNAEVMVLGRGGELLAADGGGSAILIVDAQGRRRSLPTGGAAKRTLSLEPHGLWLAAANAGGRVVAWPLAAVEPEEKILQRRGQAVNALAFSSGGVLAAGDRKGVIRLWHLPQGELMHSLEGKESPVTALSFSPDGKLLLSGTEGGTIQLWSLPAGTLRACLLDLKVSPSSSQGNTYEVRTASGRTVSYTVACGAPIPPGATCTCNCVPGAVAPPAPPPVTSSGGGGGSSYSYCTCNKVCVCIPVG